MAREANEDAIKDEFPDEPEAEPEGEPEGEPAAEPEPEGEPEPEVEPEEARARAHGWRPKDEFDGDPDDWVNHRRFNEKGDMIGQIRSLTGDLAQTKQATADSLRLNNMFKGQQIKQLETQLTAALKRVDDSIELADTEGAKAAMEEVKGIEGDLGEMKEEAKPRAPDAAAVVDAITNHPTMMEWSDKNPWLKEESEKSTFAAQEFGKFFKEHAKDYANADAMINALTKHVDAQVAAKFSSTNSNRDRPARTGGKAPRGANVRGLSMKDLTRQEKEMYDTFIDSYKDEKEFLKTVQEARDND